MTNTTKTLAGLVHGDRVTLNMGLGYRNEGLALTTGNGYLTVNGTYVTTANFMRAETTEYSTGEPVATGADRDRHGAAAELAHETGIGFGQALAALAQK